MRSSMRSSLLRTVVVISVLTALVATAGAFYIGQRLMNPASAAADTNLQPAPNQGKNFSDGQSSATDATPQLKSHAAVTHLPKPSAYSQTESSESSPVENSSYGEPVSHHRSTAKSALIVAGSAGTGAAVGALAGGGKGAGIGALAGGAAGLVYDRLTANK